MAETLRILGDWLDRIDAGGWAVMLAGVAVVGAAVLLPARAELDELMAQRAVLQSDLDRLDAQHQGHARLVHGLEHRDPLLLQRVAWRQLRVVPAGAVPTRQTTADIDSAPPPRNDDAGPQRTLIERRADDPVAPGAGNKLVAMIFGPRRTTVLCAGLVLIGLGVLSSMRPGAHRPALS